MLTITRLQCGNKRAVPLRISSYQINVEIKNQFSQTVIEQIFVNPNDSDVDGIYIFPLTDDAMISTISLSMDDEDVKGEILTTARARRVYEESALYAENEPILKYIGTRAYAAYVGKIPANGERRIRFAYSQMLSVGSVLARYTHPLSLAKATQACIEYFRVHVNIKSDFDIQWLCLPSHGIVVNDKWQLHYAETDLDPDRDFAFEYTVSDPDFGIGLITHRENTDEDGYFMLFISPRYKEQIANTTTRDFTFVLDRSESMAGEKICRAKEALRYCIHNLTNRDRFNIFAFNSDIVSLNTMDNGEEFSHELGNLTPDVLGEFLDVRHNRKKAFTFIEGIKGCGETNMGTAMLAALSVKSDPNRPRMVVLLTDGCPTNSVANASRILKNIAAANAKQARIFVFGIGTQHNVDFLDKLAINNGGIYHHLEPNEDIKEAVLSLFRKINDPGLANIDINYGDIGTEDVYPQEMPNDLFSHEQLTLVGRYKGHGHTHLEIRGHINGERLDFTKDVHFNENQSRYNFLPRLWAERKVNTLMEETGQNPRSRRESYKEIGQLMNAYGIPQTFQSPSAKPKREHILSRQWYQWCFENVKYLGRKTFYQHEHIWVDGEYDGVSETKKIVIGGPEYCDFMNREPDLKRYLKLNKEMILCHKGVSYQIVPDEV